MKVICECVLFFVNLNFSILDTFVFRSCCNGHLVEESVNMFGYECFLDIVLFSERFLCVLMKMKYQLCKIACIRGLPSSPRNQYKKLEKCADNFGL